MTEELNHWDQRIKTLMEQVGHPNSMSLYQAFKQLQNELTQRPQQATPEPVGEVFYAADGGDDETGAGYYMKPCVHWVGKAPEAGTNLFTRPAPAVPEGFVLVPVEPTAAMLHCIVYDQYPQDADEGRKLQRKQLGEPNSEDHVPFKTEFELAVGQYKRLLAAAQAKGGDK